jgi:RHS repeat-associated protein
VVTLLDPLSRTTSSGYDALNRLTTIDYSDVTTPDVGYAYDANGNRTSMTDGTGSTTYGSDELDRLVSVTSPGPKVVGYRYDLDGNRTKVIYPDATAVSYTFNKASQLSSLSDWASRSVAYTYWPDGLLRTATNPDSSVATYTYDNARRLVDILHQRASTTISHHAYGLDRNGNATNVAETVSGLTPAPTWEPPTAANDVVTNDQTQPSIAIGPSGAVHALWADTRTGNADIYYASRDPWTGTWTASVRVNDVTTNAQTQPAVAVDGAGSVYAVWTDARAGATDDDIYYAKRSIVTGTWSASIKVNDDGTGKRQYDPSLAISSTGEQIAAWYDQRGGGTKRHIYSARLLANGSIWSANLKVTSDTSAVKAEPEVAIGADGTTYAVWRDHRTGNGDVYFATLPLGGSTWSANTKVSDDPGTAVVAAPDIGVDTAGNLLAVWSDSRVSPSQIRSRRRPAGSGTWSASVVVGGSVANASAITVRPDGRAFSSWFNGTPGTLTTLWGSEYDPTTLAWTVAEQLTATGEEAANPGVAYTSMEIVVAYQRRPSGGNYDLYSRRKPLDADQFVYGLDRLYRLTAVAGPDGPRTYTFDPVGNRLIRVSGGTTAYAYDRADRISAAGATPITVDANGNLVAKGADAFGFDQANRLTSATVAGVTETYAYDGDGTRFSRQVGTNPVIRYVSDVGAGLPITIDDGTRKYIYGVGLAYAVSGSAIEVYHADRLGSVRALTDETGAVTAAFRSDEWGLSTATSGSSGQPLGFTGEPRDATGLTYLRARYYDPDLDRFMSRDTWPGSSIASQSLNGYAYANGNPVTNTDPSGHYIDTIADVVFVIYEVFTLAFGPEKDRGLNSLALAADVAFILVPLGTGGGVAVRSGGKVADEGIHLIDEAVGAACSFTGETLVATPDGSVPISEIEIGDIVLAWDETTGAVVERTVTAVLPHPDDEIARLTIDGLTVTTTPDHPFFTIERGWVEAGRLWQGAHVKTTTGVGVVAVVETAPYAAILWDLTVDDVHTFFVGETGGWFTTASVHRDLLMTPRPLPAQTGSGAERENQAALREHGMTQRPTSRSTRI